MKILIVYAHPEPQSFNGSLKDKAVETLQKEGHEVVVSDLYAMHFDPVAGKNDFKRLSNPDFFKYAKEQQHALNNDLLADPIKEEYEKLLWADFVIFQFPIWWFSMPAILKGWFDKVFLYSGIYGGEFGKYDKGALVGKKAIISATTSSPEVSYQPDGYSGDIHNQILFSINHGMIYFSGMTPIEPFIAYRISRDYNVRQNYLKQWEELLNNLENLPTIQYPSLDYFEQ